jgi:hypothetical protein
MDAPHTLPVAEPAPRASDVEDRAISAPADDGDGDGIDASSALRPRTGTVIGLLITAALVLSYFVAYPLTNALRAAEVLSPYAVGYDPRLRWMGVTFASLLGASGVIAGMFRLVSRRQMRRIDEMLDPE